MEDYALPARMYDAVGADRQLIAAQIRHALEAGALIDNVRGAVFGSEFEDEGIEDIHAAAKADQIHWPGHAAVDLDIGVTDGFQFADCAWHRREAQRARGNRRVALTLRRDLRLEFEDLAAGERHRHGVRT